MIELEFTPRIMSLERPTKIMLSRMIEVKFDIEGIHHFPNVEHVLGKFETLNDDVGFLQYPHRHRFFFTINMTVSHDNRDIEFFQFQRKMKHEILEFYNGTPVINFGAKSCEMIASDVVSIIENLYPTYRGQVRVKVSEDEENGSIVEYVLQGTTQW